MRPAGCTASERRASSTTQRRIGRKAARRPPVLARLHPGSTVSRCWPTRSGELPVTVRFWDDSTVVARDDPDAPVVLIRDEQAIAHFLRAPNQLGLGRAWVSGALDVDGDLERVLGLRHRVSELSLGRLGRARLAAAALRVAGPRALRRPPIPECEAEPGGAAALAAPRPGVGAPSLRRLEPLLRAAARAEPASTPARTSRAGTTRSSARRSASSS